jgi:hypothetical protein
MKKHKNTAVLLFLCLLTPADVSAQGIELYGRIYDGNAKFSSINDADLIITISGQEPNEIEYPKNNNGEYRAIEFNVPDEKHIEIHANHSEYIQLENIVFKTTAFKKRQDVRMIRKNTFAETNFLKAKGIRQESSEEIDKAFSLAEQSADLSPRSRYYLFLADTIGNRIKAMPENGELPSNMASFILNIDDDQGFATFPIDVKKEFYIKIGYCFAMSRNLLSKIAGVKTCLQYSIETYDKAIQLSSAEVTSYQGKYLVLRKSENYIDAIGVICDYFSANNKITSELTIKGLFVDWIDLVRVHTGFKGSDQEIAKHKSNEDYKSLWTSLYQRLEQYRKYYQNTNITGNKNLQEAYQISKRIVTDE